MINRKALAIASGKTPANVWPVVIAEFTASGVIEMNRDLIHEYGGMFAGLDNLRQDCRGRLEYTLTMSQDGFLPDDHWYRAAWLWVRMIESHLFNDGNKRTALATMLAYLAKHDKVIYLPDHLCDRLQRQIISKTIDIESLARQLKKCQ